MREGELILSDLLGPELSPASFTNSMRGLANMYRLNFADRGDGGEMAANWSSFSQQLYDMVRVEQWSEKRFADACAWIAKNVPYAILTAADFFRAPVKTLKPLLEKQGLPGTCDVYKIDGKYFWKERDGIDLPFEKVTVRKVEPTEQPQGVSTPESRERILKEVLGPNAIELLRNSPIGGIE